MLTLKNGLSLYFLDFLSISVLVLFYVLNFNALDLWMRILFGLPLIYGIVSSLQRSQIESKDFEFYAIDQLVHTSKGCEIPIAFRLNYLGTGIIRHCTIELCINQQWTKHLVALIQNPTHKNTWELQVPWSAPSVGVYGEHSVKIKIPSFIRGLDYVFEGKLELTILVGPQNIGETDPEQTLWDPILESAEQGNLDWQGIRPFRLGDQCHHIDPRRSAKWGIPIVSTFHLEKSNPKPRLLNLGIDMSYCHLWSEADKEALLSLITSIPKHRVGQWLINRCDTHHPAPQNEEIGYYALQICHRTDLDQHEIQADFWIEPYGLGGNHG